MILGSKQKLSHMTQSYSAIPRFCLETEDLDFVNETRYLGLITDDILKWDNQIKSIQIKVSQGLAFLKYTKKYVPLSTLKDLYKDIVEPNFNEDQKHCCSVWGSCGTTKLNKLQELQPNFNSTSTFALMHKSIKLTANNTRQQIETTASNCLTKPEPPISLTTAA